ncbi:hypothetical protein [Runella sp.]|uniref:hypothetical protein n=1 Tax=Runella sp. TaxID=1960881 RepID=UPI003D0DA247
MEGIYRDQQPFAFQLMPINYKFYPENWFTELRPAVLTRANNACECCKVKNYAVVRWDEDREAYYEYDDEETPDCFSVALKLRIHLKASHFYADWLVIVLTIAHLDHDIKNNDLANLKALCQRCHLKHDRFDNARRKKFGKHYEVGQLKINLIWQKN